MKQHEGSDFVRHLACSACGSSDANSEYTDGHTYCFSCGATAQGFGAGSTRAGDVRKSARAHGLIEDGTAEALRARGITQETCEFFGYTKAEYGGVQVQVAPYYNPEGQLVAQKVRNAKKEFKWLGAAKPAELLPFGAQCWARSGKKIVVTEGEIDCLSVSQVQGNKWPVVSIGCGAGPSMKKYFAAQQSYFRGFEEVVLMFDMDKPGREAAISAASVLGSRARIAELPEGFKDANDMLVKGKTAELINAMWKALPYRPEGVVDLQSLQEQVKQAPAVGLAIPFPKLSELTYGVRLGEIWVFGAGTGIGKTTLLLQCIRDLSMTHKQAVAGFFLEQGVKETATRIAGTQVQKPLHIPNAGWTTEDIDRAFEELKQGGKIFLYDSFGNNTWESVKEKIEYLHHAEGVNYFFLDHLTALATWQEDERVALDQIMSDMSSLTKKLNITLFMVSHLATPEGKPHEEGGRVTIRHFRGSRSIGYWSHYMFGLERNQQADDPLERGVTTLRVLKDRYTGRSTGETITLSYNSETGLLSESDGVASQFGLKDETVAQPQEKGDF